MRTWSRVTGEPLAMTETALYTILEIATRESETPEMKLVEHNKRTLHTNKTSK
jgi:hypothetical protein